MTHDPLLYDQCDDAIKNTRRTIAIAHTVTQITLYLAKVQILSSICCRHLRDLGATYDDHLSLIGKRVVDFLLVLIELFFREA